jgi:hypothetical protein
MMAKRPSGEQSKKAADSLRELKRQMDNGSARVMSAEKKLDKLIKSGGRIVSKNAEQVTNALEQTYKARERLVADVADLTRSVESGKERDIETGRKRVQQSHKALADAVKRLDRSITSGDRERAPSGATGHEDKPDIKELAREIYEAVLREIELSRQRTEDPWL